ncbi:hypothetical protein JG687_00005929 [Phytophthora cactorum]|uniref:Uncharacterized protein n=1 Tax=Phytophthora cactorum TaxID=29920 RepID=A0A8T1UKX0_9STRA|nr:hypothetical protein JG687_00005929 [Phytophthora cactorum]
MGIPTASRAWTNFMGEDALLDYYTAASKGSSAAAAHAPHSIPAAVSATPAAAAPRHLPLRLICEAPAGYCAAITRQATPETTEGSSDGQTPETMYVFLHIPDIICTLRNIANVHYASARVKPPSYDEEHSGASPDDADSDEEEAPVPSAPVASATGNTVPQPAMPVGRQAQVFILTTKLLYYADLLADTTDILNVTTTRVEKPIMMLSILDMMPQRMML